MADPASPHASDGPSASAPAGPPTATVLLGATAARSEPPAPRPLGGGDAADNPHPHAPATHRRGLSNGRQRAGVLTGLRLSLPGRRTTGGSNGGGRGRHRLPLRPGDGDGQVDIRNTWQVVAGSLLVPLGVVFILMSWYGAAHTAYVQQQIPYLVSGSFAGVGCMVLGGLLYWAHWLYRLYDQADLHHQEELDVLRQTLQAVVARLDASGGGVDGHAAASSSGAASASSGTPDNGQAVSTQTDDGAERFVAAEGGSYFHAPSCPVVAHHGEGMGPVTPVERGDLEPCRICRPDDAVRGPGAASVGAGRTSGTNGR